MINFEGEAHRRGLMLTKAASLLKNGGYLCIVLPKACVSNSRYFDATTLKLMLTVIGFEIFDTRSSAKLYFLNARLNNRNDGITYKGKFSKKIIRVGKTYNNFHMTL